MRDWLPKGELSFLAGNNEMAQRIRAHDWPNHALGPVETWPQSLRSALSICLHSAFPTAIYWGRDLCLLYNDAWAPIPGPRHPDALGAPAREVWADIWHIIGPQMQSIMDTGEGLFAERQMLPMARFGAPAETYWNYSFSAIRGEDGEVAGVFNCGNETTREVRSQRQMRFLIEYSEALRAAASIAEARDLALSMLGEHLGVDRVGIAETPLGTWTATIANEWTAPGVRKLDAHVPLSQFGAQFAETLQGGRSFVCDDVWADDRFDERARQAFAHLDIASFLVVPWTAQQRIEGAVFVHCTRPRDWSDFDVTTVEGLLQRTRAWVQAERAAAREQTMVREIDHRAKNALAVAQSVVRLTRAEDIDTFRRKADERLAALARAHSLLAAQHWRSIDLRELLQAELRPYAEGGSSRVALTGPEVPLPHDLAQTTALVVHELATNAAKYGALSTDNGSLAVTWHTDERMVLRLDWVEDLPEARSSEVPRRSGFGSILLNRVIEVQLGGSFEADFSPNGLRLKITVPLGELEGGAPSLAEKRAPGKVSTVVVEDETVAAVELETALKALGHEVIGIAGTIAAAEALVTRSLPRIVFLDVQTRGGGSAVEFAARLTQSGVDVVVLADRVDPSKLPPEMADLPVLSRPFDERRLSAMVSRLVGQRVA